MYIQDFFQGVSFDSYKYFGAHPLASDQTDSEGFVYRVFAPNAKGVLLCGDFNNWDRIMMDREDTGVWTLEVPNARAGDLYKYKILQEDGREVFRADPYGFRMETPPRTASKTHLLGQDFTWSDEAWMAKRDKGFDQPVNIYELHFGSWRTRKEIYERWYNYRDLPELLIPYLKEHGFTHVELMPLAEHALYRSWGYQVSGFFAVTSRYGSPEDLMYFVNEMHKADIGVIMDFVPVHFITDDFSLKQFDGTALYEYDSHDLELSEWGTANFNLRKHETQSFLQSNANFWLEEFHMDGLRYDAISNAIYWQGNATQGVNEGALYFLRKINQGLNARHAGVMLIAEDSSSFPRVTGDPEFSGLGFDYKWDLGWMHDTLDFMKLHPDQRHRHYHEISFSMMYFYSENYILPFSHDEVVHGKATISQRMWGLYADKFRQLRTLYMYMFTYPGKKLNFMGNELAHFREWDEDKEMDWFLLDYPMHAQFSDYFKTVSKLYTENPVYYSAEMRPQGFRWLNVSSEDLLVYAYERISADGKDKHIVVLNMSGVHHGALPVGYDKPVLVEEVLNTDSLDWGGGGEVNEGVIASSEEEFRGSPHSFRIKLSHFAGAVFRVLDPDEESEDATQRRDDKGDSKKQ